jgi:hypothetical protein
VGEHIGPRAAARLPPATYRARGTYVEPRTSTAGGRVVRETEAMGTGRQVKVYLHPEDRQAVADFVRGRLGCVLLRERSADRASLETADVGDGSARLICLDSQASELRPRLIEARSEWVFG